VPVQEPVLRNVYYEFGWLRAPRFPDVRGAITDVLRAATDSPEDWTWDSGADGAYVLSWNAENRLHLLASAEGLSIISEHPDQRALALSGEATLAACTDLLNVKTLSHCSAGAMWTLAAKDSRDAEAALEAWLFASEFRTRLSVLGGRPDDLIVSVRFENDTGVVTMLKAEPVTDEQAANGPFFISEMEVAEFPPAALLVSLDRRHRQEDFAASAGLARSSRHLEQILAHAEKLLATVNG